MNAMNPVQAMDNSLKRSARMLALAGVASIAFGVIVLVKPGISLLALLYIFGAFVFLAGAAMFGAGIEHLAARRTDWVPYLFGGIGGLAIGAITFFRPGVTGLALLFLIAAWAIVSGVFEVVAAFDLWDETHDSWLLGLAGILSMAFGVLIAVYPASGALAILWLIGIYAVAVGVTEVIYAVRIHQTESKAKQTFEGTTRETTTRHATSAS